VTHWQSTRLISAKMNEQTKESQYQFLLDLEKSEGVQRLGLMSSQVWRDDPKRLLFVLARYKFVAKMFSGLNKVLEIGCADAFGTRLVRQEVAHVVATDFDPVFIERNIAQQNSAPGAQRWTIEFRAHDLLSSPVTGDFDGAYAVDVIEHIPVEDEDQFIGNMARSLNSRGICLIGSPSLQSQTYASPPSKAGHVNCKDAPGLKKLMEKYFHNVFVFSMNDEIVHTGFYPMAHYLFALCCNRKA
jgi:2-polyprenyl-3-methyl-5-hydroxy-6-metoxy-1,4-benzoquinol methylase